MNRFTSKRGTIPPFLSSEAPLPAQPLAANHLCPRKTLLTDRSR